MKTKKKRIVIVSGGSIDDDFAKDFLLGKSFDAVIAADKGMEFCYRNQIPVDLVVGDFDSADLKVVAFYEKQNVPMRRLIPEKDDSDTQSALSAAADMGAQEVVFLGCTGTRMDHIWANIQLLACCNRQGIYAVLYDAHNRISVETESFTVRKNEQFGDYISFFSLGDCVPDLTLRGFKYPLTNHFLKNTDSGLTVSNEIVEDEARVSFRGGMLLMIQSKN
ncbi:MAG: thiamine diphosphokinase [Eubacteriales bacterium]|nr:thiamine diphosphokinase [Eubacteriales bacterium]